MVLYFGSDNELSASILVANAYYLIHIEANGHGSYEVRRQPGFMTRASHPDTCFDRAHKFRNICFITPPRSLGADWRPMPHTVDKFAP